MTELSNKEMMNVSGGGINFGIIALAAGGLTFLIGIFDGIVRPLKCR